MEQVIYEDKPHTDIWIKLIVLLPSIILVFSALMIMGTNLQEGICMLGVAVVTWLILNFMVIPTRYVIYDSKISIRFNSPFSFSMPFATIKAVRQASWSTFGVNLPTNLSPSNAIEILRKRRMAVTITPGDKQAFITNFENAFKEWQKYQGK
jgi:hypothetical protein